MPLQGRYWLAGNALTGNREGGVLELGIKLDCESPMAVLIMSPPCFGGGSTPQKLLTRLSREEV
jgi:hypothetical protein